MMFSAELLLEMWAVFNFCSFGGDNGHCARRQCKGIGEHSVGFSGKRLRYSDKCLL